MSERNTAEQSSRLHSFAFNGTQISFSIRDNGTVFINATEMARSFGTHVSPWKKLASAQAVIARITSTLQCPFRELYLATSGGSPDKGTWMHEDLAMEYARYLSPQLAFWVYDRLKDLRQPQLPSVSPAPESSNLRVEKLLEDILSQLQALRQDNEALQIRNNNLFQMLSKKEDLFTRLLGVTEALTN